jgi:hypothetical protein
MHTYTVFLITSSQSYNNIQMQMRLIASFLPYDPIRDKIKKTIISLNIYLLTNTYIHMYIYGGPGMHMKLSS